MNQTVRHLLGIIALLIFMLMPSYATRPVLASPERCFSETGHCIHGRFYQYWQQNGGLAVFGYPISVATQERNPDTGETFLTQWFERNRFELHPENTSPYDVLLGRLGSDRLTRLDRDWRTFPVGRKQDNCVWFAETRHAVCDAFMAYWLSHGVKDPALDQQERSTALFGLPLSEPTMETNSSGDTVLTQWFERARFEYHTNSRSPSDTVRLGLLGREVGCTSPVVAELRQTVEQGIGQYRSLLGCPGAVTRHVPAAEQYFERGMMLYVGSTVSGTRGAIYVVETSTPPMRYRRYEDTWIPGEAETDAPTPPTHRYESRSGFGKIWREQPGVREAVGWAIHAERPDQATIQAFETGSVVWLRDVDIVYVFINNSPTVTILSRVHP